MSGAGGVGPWDRTEPGPTDRGRARSESSAGGPASHAPGAPALERAGPPRLRARFGPLALPWVPLAQVPTPVEPLAARSRALGAELWVKRDDRSGARYGGNKVRKLELLLADALARGRRTVATIGAWGSHHALATAIYGAHVGLGVELALYPQPITPHVQEDLLLDLAFGAGLLAIPSPVLGPLAALALARRADRGAVIPPGGSSALGALGYVEAGLELADQVAQGALPAPDAVVVAAGTCGTVAGLALGLELAGLRPLVVAVRVVPAAIANRWLIDRLRHGARRRLRDAGAALPPRRPLPVVLDPHELGPGYGHDTPAARAAVAAFAEDGLALETTYTGKAAAAALRWAQGPLRGKRVLFWHTCSSVDLSARLAAVDPGALPAGLRRVVAGWRPQGSDPAGPAA